MKKIHAILTLGVMALVLNAARAQDNTEPSTGSASQDDGSQPQQAEPVPAHGGEALPLAVAENPPISGLDTPSLEPHAAPLSYLQPGATFSQSADSNVESAPGVGTVRSISRALGSVVLERLWSRYDLAAQYIGGTSYYNQKGIGWTLIQQLNLDQKITWKRGQLSLRDGFTYLPEGNFGAPYGSMGSQGIASIGTTAFGSFWGGTSLGTLGLVPRTTNVSIADISESLTPKSSVTAAGGYAFTHFYGNDPISGNAYLGDKEVSAQGGYDRLLTAHTQVALMYGYQGFKFSSTGSAFHSHVIQAMYGHRITGRMDWLLAAGPQITYIGLPETVCSGPTISPALCTVSGGTLVNQTFHDRRIGVAGRVRLRYQFPRTSLDLNYERYVTGGSGFFAGAQTDLAQLMVERPISRVWNGFVDLGYSRNSREQPLSPSQMSSCNLPGQNTPGLPPCPGVNASSYNYGFVGLGLHRAFGHSFHGFVSYQFNELSFDNSYCAGLAGCNRISNRHVGTIGLDWTPRPTRLD